MIGWLIGGWVGGGWASEWIGWLVGWLVGRLVACLLGCLVAWLVRRFTGGSVDRPVHISCQVHVTSPAPLLTQPCGGARMTVLPSARMAVLPKDFRMVRGRGGVS